MRCSHVPRQARLAACDRAGPFSSRPGLSWEIVLIAPQHPVECLWHSLLRPYPAFEAPFNGHGTVFFLPSWSSLFQLRMTRNWPAPVCLPGSEESGSMRRSPIGFQERRQVGSTAIRFMRVDDCLLPPVSFPDTCTKQTPTQPRLYLP